MSSVLVQHCLFQNGSHAGIADNGGSLTVEDSTFQNNASSGGSGPCLYSYQDASAINVTRCQFLGNTTTDVNPLGGGAITVGGGTLTVRDSLFAGNRGSLAGAIASAGTVQLSGVTIVDNTVSFPQSAGAVYEENGYFSAVNCIFWNNNATTGTAPTVQFVKTQGTTAIENTAIQNDYLVSEIGNLVNSYDPRFVGEATTVCNRVHPTSVSGTRGITPCSRAKPPSRATAGRPPARPITALTRTACRSMPSP